jgi:hypothetical protein
MTKHEIVELYGASVYAIRLQVAIALLRSVEPETALELADNFLRALLAEDAEDLKNKF